MITSAVAVPFLLTPALCMENDDPDKAAVISSLIFMSGIITILQSTVGNTLPIVQGGSFSYLIPSLAILNLPQWKCPANLSDLSRNQKTEEWQIRRREIQGAIIFASMFEMLFALTGKVNFRCVILIIKCLQYNEDAYCLLLPIYPVMYILYFKGASDI